MVFCKEKSELLYSYHKIVNYSSFSGTFFNKHKTSYESGSLPTDSSNIYFFLPSTTDRVEKINSHLGSVNLSPIDIAENAFDVQEGVNFDPSKLDISCPEKTAITETIVKTLKEITDLSNVKRIYLLSKRKPSDDENIEWIGSTKKEFQKINLR